jgi:hypothetical protein
MQKQDHSGVPLYAPLLASDLTLMFHGVTFTLFMRQIRTIYKTVLQPYLDETPSSSVMTQIVTITGT